MAEAGSKGNPYGVDNDPMRGTTKKSASGDLKNKQKKSVEKAFNPEDPVGDAVRSLWKKVRGK